MTALLRGQAPPTSIRGRGKEVTFIPDGREVTVAVPDEVDVALEVEVGEENEIEVEITW